MAEPTRRREPPWPHTGAMLVGGRSRRMGRPKVSLPLPGGDLLGVRVHRILAAACRSTVLIGDCAELPGPLRDLPRLPDLRPGLGPLAGWEALLASGLDTDYIIVPCDLPRLSGGLLHLLAAPPDGRPAALRRPGAPRPEPMPVRLAARQLPALRRALDEGSLAVTDFLKRIGPEVRDIPPGLEDALANLNTPGDLESL